MLLLLMACDGVKEIPVETEKTETYPQFYGEVPKNILIVSIDTTRRDLFQRYGSTEDTMPFFDRIAEEGVPLDKHRSCSNWTMASMECIVSGRTNVDAGYSPDLRDGDKAIAPELNSLAQRLQGRWSTHLVTSNSWFSAAHGLADGFDTEDSPSANNTAGVFETGKERVQEAIANGAEKWFLHLHVKEPHSAYNPPDEYKTGLDDLPPAPWDWDLTNHDDHYDAKAEYEGLPADEQELLAEYLWVLYRGEVRYMNDEFEAAMADYDAAGLLDDTLVVFVNDHGEQFWEHGEQTHAYGLNLEENDGFALFWSKKIIPQAWEGPTSHVDIVPTILALQGEPVTDDLSGYPVGTAPDDVPIDAISVARSGVVQSVVVDDWKLVYEWATGRKMLYDLEADPLEQTNLYTSEDPHALALWNILQPLVDRATVFLPNYTPVAPGP